MKRSSFSVEKYASSYTTAFPRTIGRGDAPFGEKPYGDFPLLVTTSVAVATAMRAVPATVHAMTTLRPSSSMFASYQLASLELDRRVGPPWSRTVWSAAAVTRHAMMSVELGLNKMALPSAAFVKSMPCAATTGAAEPWTGDKPLPFRLSRQKATRGRLLVISNN